MRKKLQVHNTLYIGTYSEWSIDKSILNQYYSARYQMITTSCKGAVTLRNFLSNLSRNAVVKQVAGPCYTVQSFSATFNIFGRGKLKTPRTQIVSEQNNKFAHAFVKKMA